MALLDIERIINQEDVGSRFKLVYLAGLRAREINSPTDDTIMPTVRPGQKITTKALTDLINNKIGFEDKI